MNEQLARARSEYVNAREAFEELGVVQESSTPLHYPSGAEMLKRGAEMRDALDRYIEAIKTAVGSQEPQAS